MASAHTAIPYDLEKLAAVQVSARFAQTGRWTVRGEARARVITLIFPAVLARISLFSVEETGTIVTRAESEDETGANVIKKFVAKSWKANYTGLGEDEILKRISYRVSSTTPFLDVWSTHTEAKVEVEANDIIIWAASDTSPNADVAYVDVAHNNISFQNLLSTNYIATLTNPDTGREFKVSSLLRVDRVKGTGEFSAIFRDVTGSIMAIRLTPVWEIKTGPATAYTAPPTGQDYAYFYLDVPTTDRLVPRYPNWLISTMKRLKPRGRLGLVDNFRLDTLAEDEEGTPILWQERRIFAIHRDDLNFTNIPSSGAYVFADRDEMEDERERLLASL
jgi:hypothetical protein